MDGLDRKETLSTGIEVGTSQAGEGRKGSSHKSSKTRNRFSAKVKKAKLGALVGDYRAGHPQLAIMLRQHLSKPQFHEMLAHAFMTGQLTPIVPSYELVVVSTPIKSLLSFADNSVEYVRVEQTERGTLLTPYRTGDENELTC